MQELDSGRDSPVPNTAPVAIEAQAQGKPAGAGIRLPLLTSEPASLSNLFLATVQDSGGRCWTGRQPHYQRLGIAAISQLARYHLSRFRTRRLVLTIRLGGLVLRTSLLTGRPLRVLVQVCCRSTHSRPKIHTS
jgi:hypothetical protein